MYDDHTEKCQDTYSRLYVEYLTQKEESEAELSRIMRVIHNESKTNIIRQHKSLLSRLKVAVENAVYTKMPYPQMPGKVILVMSQTEPA